VRGRAHQRLRLVKDVHMVLNHVLVGYFRERLEQEEDPAPA
jgi:hypothetical protein